MSTIMRRTKPRILCIDDDPAITAALEMRLASYEIELQTAFFGMHGIWLAFTQSPNLIITDLRMPNGEGDSVVECLKRRRETCDIPVIVLTGCRDQTIQRRMLLLGVEHFLHKPLNLGRLVEKLSHYVDLLAR